jgi:hypothetical protein
MMLHFVPRTRVEILFMSLSSPSESFLVTKAQMQNKMKLHFLSLLLSRSFLLEQFPFPLAVLQLPVRVLCMQIHLLSSYACRCEKIITVEDKFVKSQNQRKKPTKK